MADTLGTGVDASAAPLSTRTPLPKCHVPDLPRPVAVLELAASTEPIPSIGGGGNGGGACSHAPLGRGPWGRRSAELAPDTAYTGILAGDTHAPSARADTSPRIHGYTCVARTLRRSINTSTK